MHARQLETFLSLWPEAQGGKASLINLSENHTFLVDAPARRVLVRVHRPGYQSHATIAGELAWIDALGRDTDLLVPKPLPGRDGRLIQVLRGAGGERPAVMFHYFDGAEPQEDGDLEALFGELGRMAAITHAHARAWNRPAGFVRQHWNADTILSSEGQWGDWRRAPQVAGEIASVLQRLQPHLRADLNAYGMSAERYGLIHADMRLANVIRNGATHRLIDFDDMGFGWYIYDFGAALSFIETRADAAALRDAWIAGYCEAGRLTPEDIAVLDAMVLLRRMALLAWIGTHLETELAQAHAPDFAAGTAMLAERYLGR